MIDVRGGTQLVGQRLELLGRPGHQHQLVAATGQVAGDLGTDAPGGACDDGDMAGGGWGQGHIGTYA